MFLPLVAVDAGPIVEAAAVALPAVRVTVESDMESVDGELDTSQVGTGLQGRAASAASAYQPAESQAVVMYDSEQAGKFAAIFKE